MNFVSSPLGEKRVSAVPGIGLQTELRFASKGIVRASQLLGIYLQNPMGFLARLMTEGVYSHHAGWAYNALYQFSNTYIL